LRNVTLACALVLPGLAAAEPVQVVALGDSLTAGYGLAEGEGFVPQLQAWLKANGSDAVVANAGVSGDTSAGGLSRLDWALAPGADALIVTLGGNDMLRGIDPAATRANLDAILAKAQEKGLPVLLVGMQAPGNYGPDYKAEFDAAYPELAASHRVLFAESFLGPLLAQAPDAAALAPWLQADGIHPNADGVKIIVAGLGPKVLELVGQVK
jgi:acyl-CoA thioesterase-1